MTSEAGPARPADGEGAGDKAPIDPDIDLHVHPHRVETRAERWALLVAIAIGGGHRIGVGDLIISRRNDPTVELRNITDRTGAPHPVRNGNRWRVAGIDPATNRMAAERLDDGARVVFEGDYLREHITHGYAVTVHSAQGVTADTTHAVL
jgi:ATP-dependent exoDNAse (exonuclease V) alpha subunit